MTKNSSFKPISTLAEISLSRLKHTIDNQLSVLDTIRRSLPDDIAKHTLHCLINDNILVILTDSGIWASQIRFYRETILATLNRHNPKKIITLQVKISLLNNPVSPTVPAQITTLDSIEKQSPSFHQAEKDQLQTALNRLSLAVQQRTGIKI
jgi:hypothetical protein